MSWHLKGTFAQRRAGRRAIGAAACLAMLLVVQPADAAILFSYDPSGGQLPTDQGWLGFEVDADGPLTAVSAGGAVSGTAAANANAAIENVGGANVLHIRDTLETAAAVGLQLTDPEPPAPADVADPLTPHDGSFDPFVDAWRPLVGALNAVSRSMGERDLYPFVLTAPVIEKLSFVHECVRTVGQ